MWKYEVLYIHTIQTVLKLFKLKTQIIKIYMLKRKDWISRQYENWDVSSNSISSSHHIFNIVKKDPTDFTSEFGIILWIRGMF